LAESAHHRAGRLEGRDFVLGDVTGPVLLISAGIGVTPVLAMLHRLAEQHDTFGQQKRELQEWVKRREEEIEEQAARLLHVSNLFYTAPMVRLAVRLAERSIALRREDLIHVDTYAMANLIAGRRVNGASPDELARAILWLASPENRLTSGALFFSRGWCSCEVTFASQSLPHY